MTAFDQGKAGVASGINNAASRASGLLAVALFGALVTLIFNSELASALAAIDRLTESATIGPDDTVVAVLTASGLKDAGVGVSEPRRAPMVSADLDSVRGALRDTYGFDG